MKIRYVSPLRVLELFPVALSWALVLGPGVEARLLAGEKKKSPSPYESRKVKDRVKEFEELGLTVETEKAVSKGLKWLATMQQPDGRWKLDDPRWKDKAGASNDTAGTAF